MANKPMKAIPPDLQEGIDRLKTAVTDAGARAQSVADTLSTRMSDADVENAKAQLGFIKDLADGIATNPVDPPPPPPEPVQRR